MARRAKATGCGKFFLVMIILIPLSFVGASLFTGKNPLDALSELFGGEVTVVEDQIQQDEMNTDASKDEDAPVSAGDNKNQQALKEEVAAKERMIDRLESRIGLLEEELDKCQAELQKRNN